LNKCDLISEEKKKFLHSIIRRVNAMAPIFDTSHGKVDLSLLLSTGRFSIQIGMEEEWKSEHKHGHEDLQVFAYTPSGKLKARELDHFFEDLTTDVYRVKGFVEFLERP
jgi:G3E family GTPase